MNAVSHAAVFPFTAMSVMGMALGALVLGEALGRRKVAGIAVVLVGLVLVSGLDAASFSARAVLGDAMFVAAGSLWAGFGILLRRHRPDPLLTTAVVSLSALATYVPAYFWWVGSARLMAVAPPVFWTEVLARRCGRACTHGPLTSTAASTGRFSHAAMPPLKLSAMCRAAWHTLRRTPNGTWISRCTTK